jgi:hypothetical protein
MWIPVVLLISLLVWLGIRNERRREAEDREAFIRKDLCR